MSKVATLLKQSPKPKTIFAQNYHHVYIDKEIGQELKEYCAETGVTMKDLVSALIQDHLDEETYRRSRERG